MDPTVALAHIREQLDLAERAPSLAHANVHRERACEAMRGLDAFISSGGFLPSQWTEAQRRALENTRCERPTLAGTTVPVPCPPEYEDPLANELGTRELTRQQQLLAKHVRREVGAYDDPAVQRAIHESLHTNPWEV